MFLPINLSTIVLPIEVVQFFKSPLNLLFKSSFIGIGIEEKSKNKRDTVFGTHCN